MRNRLLLIFALMGALLVLFIALPLGRTLLASSPALLGQTLREAEVRSAILLTFGASALATLLALVLGVPLAYVLARADFPGKALVEALLDIPVVVPHSAAGIALLLVFGRDTALGRLFGLAGVRFVSAVPGIVIAMLFVSLSFLVNAARDGFRSVDARLEKVARTLGASPWEAFWQITLPLAWRSVLSGVIMMWARGLSEFGAVVILAYHPMVAPVLIFERFESYGLNYARPVATLVILISLVVFLVLRWVGRPPREPRPTLSADVSLEEPLPAGREGTAPRPGVGLRLQDVHLTLGQFRVQHLTLEVRPGEYFILLGPTGSGKSTILDAVCLALYGRTPRLNAVNQSGNEIMSRQTGECFAEVVFESQGSNYISHWSQKRARGALDGRLQAAKFEISEMSDAATDTNCFGETSMKSIFSRGTLMKSPAWRALTRASIRLPSSSSRAFACAMMYRSSSHAER